MLQNVHDNLINSIHLNQTIQGDLQQSTKHWRSSKLELNNKQFTPKRLFPETSPTTVRFPDISKFFTRVVTLFEGHFFQWTCASQFSHWSSGTNGAIFSWDALHDDKLGKNSLNHFILPSCCFYYISPHKPILVIKSYYIFARWWPKSSSVLVQKESWEPDT